MSVNNGECTAESIWGETSDGLVQDLLYAPIAGHCKQTIAPRCHKHCRFRHQILFYLSTTIEKRVCRLMMPLGSPDV
jgi:hypothetical protein